MLCGALCVCVCFNLIYCLLIKKNNKPERGSCERLNMTTAEKEIKRDKIFKMGKGKSCTYTLEMAFDCFNHSLRFSHWT